jgi:glycosyltransferase involved in cell wall biosynthesis
MRIALLAAFPFPLPQGSQVYVREQARALAQAGAEVTLFCYGHGDEGSGAASLDALRASGVSVQRAHPVLSRTPLRAGPSLAKPVADAALLATLLSAERRERFDAVLAHNAEAALVARAARVVTGTPFVYVAHTLLGHELSSYVPQRLGRMADGFGRRLDRFLARSADGVIALCTTAERTLARHARGNVARIAPALDAAADPTVPEIHAACTRAGVAPGRFALYAGNLDAYQELELLADPDLPVLVATHDATRDAPHALRVLRVRDAAEVRALAFAAGAAVLARRRPGGFPIKLLNYMEARLAIVAFGGVADGLRHDRDAWLLGPTANARELTAAVQGLLAEPERAARLGTAARRRLETHHGGSEAAARTLALVAAVREAANARGAASVRLGVRRPS